MRVQLISDLHLEQEPDFMPEAAPGTDLLVLAGDIGSYQRHSRLEGDDFGLARFSPRRPGALWRRVLYVPGNHEFDGLPYEATRSRLRIMCEALGITWLEGQVVTFGAVRFIGSTLWSDFDAFAGRERSASRQSQLREKAYRAANHYLRKNTTLIGGLPALAEQVRALSLDAQAWLRGALTQPFTGTTVVVTHFAPTLRSADPRYGLVPGTAGFCNAMDDLLPLASVWMHGHLHCTNDYVVEGVQDGRPYACRVVANARGYRSKGEHASYREHFTVDIASS